MRFDFNESNILNQNLFNPTDDKSTLLTRLNNVLRNTEDPLLKKSSLSLIGKIEALSNEDVKLILYDVLKKRFIVSANYKVINRR